jgi:hypothetical protein
MLEVEASNKVTVIALDDDNEGPEIDKADSFPDIKSFPIL